MAENRSYSTFGATLLTVTMRWTDRAIGISSTLILARLLMPEDFGIIAMASLAIAFADVVLAFSVHVALIQNQQATQAHYDTAWTLRLLQTIASMLVLILIAPLAADYFEEARLQLVLQLLSLTLLLAGLENIGIIDFQKHMQFGAEFRFRFLRRIITFAITVTVAVWLRSYWALVIGTLAGKAIGVVLSYWVHPMRPRISFEKFREIFHVSKWMMVNRIGVYFQKNLHKILIGRWSPTGTMGAYTLADEISSMPTGELLAPINRALFPSFAKVKDDPARLKEIFLLAQGVQTLIAVPAAAGLAVIAQEAVPILLGDNWDATIPFIQVLALVNIAQALTTSGVWVLIVIGRVRTSALFGWVQVALFAVLALTVFYESEAINIAWLRLLVGGTGLWLLLWLLVRGFPLLRAREVVANSFRPLLAAAVMALCVTYMATQLAVSIILALVLKVAVGAIVYTASIAALWRLAGRPPGAESYVLGKASSLIAAWRRNRKFR